MNPRLEKIARKLLEPEMRPYLAVLSLPIILIAASVVYGYNNTVFKAENSSNLTGATVRVFNDTNGNGVQDEGETPRPNTLLCFVSPDSDGDEKARDKKCYLTNENGEASAQMRRGYSYRVFVSGAALNGLICTNVDRFGDSCGWTGTVGYQELNGNAIGIQ